MPPDEPADPQALHHLVEQMDCYPLEAFHFVQQGLSYSVEKFHGGVTDPKARRHISGQQLCEGLREFALMKWGLLARTVLRRWEINNTFDFGRIVFAMVDNGLMQKTDEDNVEDFRDVYDFKSAFEADYRIPPEPAALSKEARP
ncbi:MAG TPA: Minf_1886 family protein [Tepidisphaeraceae bacterium]|jgi:uncharacterized repeat protein (TIGR04138 family)